MACLTSNVRAQVNGTIYDYYNANSGDSEQSGLATLRASDFPGVRARII